MLLDFINDARISKGRAIVSEVDGFRELRKLVHFAASIFVALFKGLKCSECLAFEAQGGGDFVPVEFEGGGALEKGVSGFRSSIQLIVGS